MAKYFIFITLISYLLLGCQVNKKISSTDGNILKTNEHTLNDDDINVSYIINKHGDTIPKLVLSDVEWAKRLSPIEYEVLRNKGTEKPFTNLFTSNKKPCLYTCKGCGIPLFHSKHKFDSGTGWPSFFDIVDQNLISKNIDYLLGYARTEISCAKCNGHLGHVFVDGPKPTGLRYCINSVSIDYVAILNGN